MSSEVATAEKASGILQGLSWLVLLLGGVLGAAALYWGFTVTEPWDLNGYVMDENWKSAGIGIASAVYIAVYAGVVWGLIQAARAVIWYVTRKAPVE